MPADAEGLCVDSSLTIVTVTDTPLPKPLQSGQTVTPWLMVVLVVVLFSGGLFGYDQGVISRALHTA